MKDSFEQVGVLIITSGTGIMIYNSIYKLLNMILLKKVNISLLSFYSIVFLISCCILYFIVRRKGGWLWRAFP